ncbi:MAG: nitrite/sulfite reductase, partial [Bacteroidota bacterium]
PINSKNGTIKAAYGLNSNDVIEEPFSPIDIESNQIHHVLLERTPELWSELEKSDVTLREACGNTVRNITASPLSGLISEEPFDALPYARSAFKYFLRHPVCQEMGRKFKISFSNNRDDSAFGFMHDLGFIATVKGGKRGFKVLIAGGLGAQPFLAETYTEFLPEKELLQFIEATLRVFDQRGERNKRHKARFKFLMKEYGLDGIRDLVEEQRKNIPTVPLNLEEWPSTPSKKGSPYSESFNSKSTWFKANVISQKQNDLFSVGIKTPLGDLSTDLTRSLIQLLDQFDLTEYRITPEQNLLIPHVSGSDLEKIQKGLNQLGLGEEGYRSLADVTSCPGTDTCNLAITNSTDLSRILDEIIMEEYPHLMQEEDLNIKISGCMNSCGQHVISGIGLHGSTIRTKEGIVPAMQVLLGGGVLNGQAQYGDKVIKIPTKRIPDTIRQILTYFELKREKNELFLAFYNARGKKHFYDLLKPLASVEGTPSFLFQDWGSQEAFKKEIGIGECAGVVVDLVQTLLFDTAEKLEKANQHLKEKNAAFSVYESYGSFIGAAKALLIQDGHATNSYAQIAGKFQEEYIIGKEHAFGFNEFEAAVFKFKDHKIDLSFAKEYYQTTLLFNQQIKLITQS